MPTRPTLACYYFPEYHPDARNAEWHGKNWTEWELVKRAEPKFEGHYQPKVPLWGYEDESCPSVMEKKIKCAADYGVDVFLFDWYWYEDGPFLERCLEQGYLKAKNNDQTKFAIMWANHNWSNQHPAPKSRNIELLADGKVSRKAFDEATTHCIETYFKHPSYWRTNDGGLYFSFYSFQTLVEGLGGLDETREALDAFRHKTESAGLGKLHLNVILQSTPIDIREDATKKYNDEVTSMGFDSITGYIWHWKRLFAKFPITQYKNARDQSIEDWQKYTKAYDLPFYPNVTMGWDSSPRTLPSDEWGRWGGTYTPVVVGNTPIEFEKALAAAKNFLSESNLESKFLTINAWNEWTESSYLEPDTVHEYGYLEAIKRVFGVKTGN